MFESLMLGGNLTDYNLSVNYVLKGTTMDGPEASDLIEMALKQAIQTNDGHEENDLIVEWALIAYVTNPDKDKGNGYPMFFSQGDIPTHRAIGLFQKGLKELENL
jgi:hypothetical protein